MKEVKSCMFYEKGQCALSGSCALTDCEFKHHFTLPRVLWFFNVVNKYHGVMIEWYSYRDGVISFGEFLRGAWNVIWEY